MRPKQKKFQKFSPQVTAVEVAISEREPTVLSTPSKGPMTPPEPIDRCFSVRLYGVDLFYSFEGMILSIRL